VGCSPTKKKILEKGCILSQVCNHSLEKIGLEGMTIALIFVKRGDENYSEEKNKSDNYSFDKTNLLSQRRVSSGKDT